MTEASQSPSKGHPFLIYSLARIALLLICAGIFYLLGFRDILLILLAFLVSGVISFIVLNRQRDEMGNRIGGYFSRMNKRIDDSTSSEDDPTDSVDHHEIDLAESAHQLKSDADASKESGPALDIPAIDITDSRKGH